MIFYKITLRCHRSRPWREESLHPGLNEAYGDSERCPRAPLQGANDVWVAPCSRVIFSQKSPFAVTVHAFGVRGICIPAPTGPTVIAKGATGTLVSAAPQKTPRALKGRTEFGLIFREV